jgi:hypothetical protein
MRHPVAYTFLGFYFNSLVDSGEVLSLEETHTNIRNKTLFKWLKIKYSDRLDISLFSNEQLNQIENFFESTSIAVDEERKMGIENNGLCLLVAYCFEAAQRREENLI